MDPTQMTLEAVMAIASTLAIRGAPIAIEKAKEIVVSITNKNPRAADSVDVDAMAEKIHAAAGRVQVGQLAYNEETLARFLEIPVPDLATITPDTLELNVLYDHIRLERLFSSWLQEWGYVVAMGCSLVGLRGVEYVPDAYGVLTTLHGEFEVCISLVSDSPPDEDRIFALLGKIEAYAEAKKTFSFGDVFAIVTPHRFTQGALNALQLQNEQESYSVLPLDGGDVYVLENSQCAKDRLDELQDKVRQAEEESRRYRIKRRAEREAEQTP